MDESLEYTLKKIPRPSRTHCRALGNILNGIVREQGLGVSEMENRKRLIQFLNEELSKSFTCKVTLFGSSITSLGFASSDINGSVFFDLNKVPGSNNSVDVNGNPQVQVGPRNDPDVLNRLMYFFTSHPGFSTPELMFKLNTAEVHVRSTRKGDSFSNIVLNWQYQVGIDTTHLLVEYVKMNPVVRPLLVVFRKMAKVCKFHSPEFLGLSSVSFAVLVIFFLQKIKLLPVLKHNLMNESSPDMPPYIEVSADKVGFLWLRLLRFYAVEFDFKECTLSINEEKQLHDGSPLHIQDPVLPTMNIAMDENGPVPFEQIFESIKSAYFYFAIPRTIHGSLYDRISPPDNEVAFEKCVFHHFVKSSNDVAWTPLEPITSASAKWNPLEIAQLIKGENWRDYHDFIQYHLESIKVRMISKKLDENKILTYVIVDDVALLSDIFLEWFYTYKFKETCLTQFVKNRISTKNNQPKPPVVLPGKAIIPPAAPFILGPFAGQPLLQYLQQPFIPPPGTHIQAIAPPPVPAFIPPFGPVPPVILPASTPPLMNPMQPLIMGARPLMQILPLNVHPLKNKNGKPELLRKVPPTVLPQAVVKPRTVSSNSRAAPEPLNEDLVALNKIMYQNLDTEGLTEEDAKIRGSVTLELKQILSATYPSVEFEMFGSSCNGFGTKHSDMDISASFGAGSRTADHRTTLKQIAKILKNFHLKFSYVTFIDASVPIVKFCHSKYNLEGDISIENRLAVANTKLLRTYADIDPRVKVLGSFVKSVTKMCDISDASAGGLSSYGFTLMVIYYLQQMEPPVLPVLQEINHDKVEPSRIYGWDVSFFQDIKNLHKFWPRHGHNKMSVGELWLGFLYYYVEVFNFDQLVISIRQSSPLAKDSKMWPKAKKRFIAIEDPFDISRNLAKNLSRKMTHYILSVFEYMLEACYSKCVSNQMLRTYESWRKDGNVFLLEGHPLYKPPKPKKPKKQKTPEEIAARKKRLLERKIQREQERLQKLQNNNKKD